MKKLTITMAGLGLAFLSSAAMGGLVQPFPVDVDLKNAIANGDMVSARNSSNATEFIGCGIRKVSDGAGGVFEFGFCQAEDKGGDRIACNTTDAGLLDAISSSNDFSFVTFGWDASNQCTRIGFSNQSFYLPKGL